MAWAKLQLKPGINTQVSKFASEATWVSSQLIRWFQGMLQKLGGWQRMTSQAVIGVARGMHAWEDLANNPYIIIGTNERVQLFDGGQIEDITPLKAAADNVTPNFSTTIGLATVTVHDVGSDTVTGDWVYIPVYVSVGGIIIYGYYQVTSIDTDNYTIIASSAATSTVSNGGVVAQYTTTNGSPTVTVTLPNHGFTTASFYSANVSTTVGGLTILGTYAVASPTTNTFTINAGGSATSGASAYVNSGNVQFQYLIPTGAADPITESGWGGGNWGGGSWGVDDGTNTAITPVRQWFFDNWGQDAVGNYTNGGLYYWMPPYVTNPRMVVMPNAPTANTASFVAMPQQIMVALGAETGGTQDLNLIRWSDVADFTDWTATVTNQAGSFRIPTGSHIVGGLQGPLQGIIWTDVDAWVMQYIQPPFIFGFTRVGQGCGLLCARGMAILNTVVYWIGAKSFYYFAGGNVQNLPCDVWDQIFNNIDSTRTDKVFAAANSLFNEISWFYPSITGGGEIDSYVKVCLDPTLGPTWDYGFLVRTCWTDESVFGPPIGTDGNGLLQQHEVSNDADGLPLISSATTSYSDISQGEAIGFIDLLTPVFNDTTSSSTQNLVLYGQKSQVGPLLQKGPYFVTNQTAFITTRMRARFIGMQVGSTDMGSFWRFNTLRFRVGSDGNWQ